MYRHIKVNHFGCPAFECVAKELEGIKKPLSFLSLRFMLDHVRTLIPCTFPFSFLLTAISVVSRSTSPRLVMLQELQQCGVMVTQKHQELRTSKTWRWFHYTSILAAECASADTKKAFFFFSVKVWGGFGPHKGRGHAMTLYLYTGPLPGSQLFSLLGMLLRYKCNRHILSVRASSACKRSECLKAFSSLQSFFIFS